MIGNKATRKPGQFGLEGQTQKLGTTWADKANQLTHQTGLTYYYMMVFDSNPVEGALTVADMLKLLRNL